MGNLDIQKLRKDTPGTKHVIHFNNAGASLMPQLVMDAVLEYYNHELKYGGYETMDKLGHRLEAVHQNIAHLINSSKTEIAFTTSATVAWNLAFHSIDFSEGDEVLVSVAEYVSNYLNLLQFEKLKGIKIKVIPNNEYGETDVDALRKMINRNTKLIAITHVPTNGGLVNPAIEIGKVAKEKHVLYLLDACQSLGQLKIDVKEIGCDFLAATGRKYMRAPRGTGFLYVRKEILEKLEPPFLDFHSADWSSENEYVLREGAVRFERFEESFAAKAGLAAATKYILDLGIENIETRVSDLATYMRIKLSEIDEVEVHDLGNNPCGIVTFTKQGIEPDVMRNTLYMANINTSVAFKQGALLDMKKRNLQSLLRASVHYYNTHEEIDALLYEIRKFKK